MNKRKIIYLLVISCVVFALLSFTRCSLLCENTSCGEGGYYLSTPTPDCEDVSPPFEIDEETDETTSYADDCVSEEIPEVLLDTIILEGALGGTFPDPIPEIDGDIDISFICNLEIYDLNVVNTFINQCEFDDLFVALNDFFMGTGSVSEIKAALDDFLELITENDTIMNGLKDSIADTRDSLTAAEIACLGQWISDSIVFLACDLEETGGKWIKKFIEDILYPEQSTSTGFPDKYEAIFGTLFIGFTADDALAVLDNLEVNLISLAVELLYSLDQEPAFIAYMRIAETSLPTDSDISDAVDEIVDHIYAYGTEAIAEFIYDMLDVISDNGKDIMAEFFTPENIRELIPALPGLIGAEGTIDCILSVEEMECN